MSDVLSQTQGEGDASVASSAQTRFSFYNADELTTSKSSPPVKKAPPKENQADSVKILKSLQEHEQQRLEILSGQPRAAAETKLENSSNPYEDAIKEALDLLRKHRNEVEPIDTRSPRENDPILQSRNEAASPDNSYLGEAYQAEIESRRKQRQERMAKYASRLAELKQEPPSFEEKGPFADIESMSTLSAAKEQDEVQRGVEKVLLAILERANSRGRGTNGSWQQGEEKKSSTDDENSLLNAMASLLQKKESDDGQPKILPSLSDDPISASRSMDEIIPPIESNEVMDRQLSDLLADGAEDGGAGGQRLGGLASAHMSDELDELVAKFSDGSTPLSDNPIDARVRRILHETVSGETTYTTSTEGDEEEDESIEGTSLEEQSTRSSSDEEESDEEEGSESSYESEEEGDPHNDTIDGVLGPLSKGGATGVVLEVDSPGPESPTLLESISAAMSLVAGNVSNLRDKYSNDEEEDGRSTSSVDSQANELMRSLCAHLLPFGVDQSSRLLEKRPHWDESNPDEVGYRVVRLTNQQLRQVEREFELMVENLKRHSEDNLREQSGSDETFERDLKAAEDLLDQQEQRLAAESTSVGLAPTKTSSMSKAEEEEAESVGSVEEDHGLACFPGVKGTGKGEMGDLEYFHLPIIFKSHVTGFEPTKDLYLEAGNIVAGQYLVEGELGSAAFSTAYRCIDLNSTGSGPDGHEEVCLKVIKNTKDFFDQSLDEIKILELLRQTGKCHEKSIIEMKTFFYYREHLIIVTELLRQNLFEFGKFIIDHDEEPYFTMPRLAYITRQVLHALDFVHSLGLVHSDVKPENILLGSYSRAKVKLIDFGSSCFLTDRQSSYIQSRSYRAPEVVLGLPYDGRIDIWSLGCVVAEMFTGEVTFQNDSIVSMLSRIESICGPFPRHMIAQGRQSGRFFTRCGLLFERADGAGRGGGDDDDSESSASAGSSQNFDIFQPKITTLSARLGFEADLMDLYDNKKKMTKEQKKRALFVDFVRKLLTVDPESRPTAAQALEHPWMQYATTITEEDIKYPG